MRETMERMEEERAEMVAEVEAQIERALASMAVDVEESDYGEMSSRPGSRMSATRSASGRSRRSSDAVKEGSVSGSRLRSVGTESTLAEQYENGDETLVHGKTDRETNTIEEEDETPSSPAKKKRFSATQGELVQDGMMAVDEGISERSDRIAQKVLQIQQKVSFLTLLMSDAGANRVPSLRLLWPLNGFRNGRAGLLLVTVLQRMNEATTLTLFLFVRAQPKEQSW